MTKAAIAILILVCTCHLSFAQKDCSGSYAKLLGSLIDDERGYSLAGSESRGVLYAGGLKNDSVLIIKVKSSGEIVWTRTFDVVKGTPDHINGMFLDSDGNLVVAGTATSTLPSGSVFVFKYNPDLNSVLWAFKLSNPSITSNLTIIEMGPGGNYLLSANSSNPNDAELTEIDRVTGGLHINFSKQYNLGSSETFFDLAYYEDKVYACGRFTDGGTVAEMRNTLVRLNAQDGSVEWITLGHRSKSSGARFYTADLVIDQAAIYSVLFGDENGSSVDDTELFIQKTALDGNVAWIKKYNLPGTNDWADEIIATGDGFVIMCRNRVPPSDIILFKIDHSGNLLWANKYDFSNNDNSITQGAISSQLIELDNHFYFTAFAQTGNSEDMIIVKTDLSGQISDSCLVSSPVDIIVSDVQNAVFYSVTPDVFSYTPEISTLIVKPEKAEISINNLCVQFNPIVTETDTIICDGESFEGYTEQGIYVDYFVTAQGCDSNRTLRLQIKNQIATSVNKEICPGDSYEGYFSTGIYIDTFVASGGCDSVRTLNLDIGIPEKIQNIEICQGGHFEKYKTAGIYIDTLAGINSTCDTIRRLTISVQAPIIYFTHQTICAGEDYFGYAIPGVYTDTLTTPEGCDSIRTVSIGVMDTVSTYVTATICDIHYQNHPMPGIYKDTLQSSFGCDSIIVLNRMGAFKYIPNVFSPNGDGVNDVFEIFQFPDRVFDLIYFAVFDRSGNMAYETNTWPIQWNGKGSNGELYNPGVYGFVLQYSCGQEKITETGDITLLK